MTHPIESVQATIGQIPTTAIDAPADAGPEARAQILRLQLRIGKLEARLAQATVNAPLADHHSAASIVEAMGISAHNTKEVHLSMAPNALPTVTVTSYLPRAAAESLATELRQFELKPKEAA
jgi:hypothetical protein